MKSNPKAIIIKPVTFKALVDEIETLTSYWFDNVELAAKRI